MQKKGQQRLDLFWSSWQNEYLLSLRESLHSQRKQRRTAINITPSINTIVQIKDDVPRGIPRFGRITEVYISYDGQVCAASVKTFLGKSICHLFSLELSYGLEFEDRYFSIDVCSEKFLYPQKLG